MDGLQQVSLVSLYNVYHNISLHTLPTALDNERRLFQASKGCWGPALLRSNQGNDLRPNKTKCVSGFSASLF